MGRWDDGTLGRFCPMMAVDSLDPSVSFPAHDDVTKSALASACFQCTEIIARECWSQLVEHGVISTISLTLILSIDIFVSECLAEGLDLLLETILGHHQGKLDTSLGDARATLPLTPP